MQQKENETPQKAQRFVICFFIMAIVLWVCLILILLFDLYPNSIHIVGDVFAFIAALVLFNGMMYAVIKDLFWSNGQYRLSSDGIELKYILLRDVSLKWSDVKSITIENVYKLKWHGSGYERYYALYLVDESKFDKSVYGEWKDFIHMGLLRHWCEDEVILILFTEGAEAEMKRFCPAELLENVRFPIRKKTWLDRL